MAGQWEEKDERWGEGERKGGRQGKEGRLRRIHLDEGREGMGHCYNTTAEAEAEMQGQRQRRTKTEVGKSRAELRERERERMQDKRVNSPLIRILEQEEMKGSQQIKSRTVSIQKWIIKSVLAATHSTLAPAANLIVLGLITHPLFHSFTHHSNHFIQFVFSGYFLSRVQFSSSQVTLVTVHISTHHEITAEIETKKDKRNF